MLERQGGDYCRVLGVGLSSRAYLRSVDENLSDPAIVKPANAAGLRHHGKMLCFQAVQCRLFASCAGVFHGFLIPI